MPHPMLPTTAPGEVLLVGTAHPDSERAGWYRAPELPGWRWEGEVLAFGGGGVRLRAVRNPQWENLRGGNIPALVPAGSRAPVVALVDASVVYADAGLLLIDVREVPGRGVRVPAESLEHVLTGLVTELLHFDDLVRGMDRCGYYQGDGGAPRNPTPTAVVRTSLPQLPTAGATLLVRTDFADTHGWDKLLDRLGELDDENEVNLDFEFDGDEVPFHARVVDDRAFESLQPGQVPALVPAGERPTIVALADSVALADPELPLLVVDLYHAPGQSLRIPYAEAGSMVGNLEIANMDFFEFG